MTRPTGSSAHPRRRILGVDIDAISMGTVLDDCAAAVDRRRPLSIGVVNAAKLVNLRKDPELARSVVTSDLVLADGQSVVWASRVLRRPLPERVAGIDLFERLLDAAERRGDRVYLLGAAQEVLEALLARFAAERPALNVVGAQNGYFAWERAGVVAEEIRASGAELLFVGMSSPRKERFLAEYGGATGAVVRHGVGGSFDVVAGLTKRAPAFWQDNGLEWLYRVLQEPRRLWKRYLVTNTGFLGLVAREAIRPLPAPAVTIPPSASGGVSTADNGA